MSTAASSPRKLFPRSTSLKWAEHLIRLLKENDKTKWQHKSRYFTELSFLSFQVIFVIPQEETLIWFDTRVNLNPVFLSLISLIDWGFFFFWQFWNLNSGPCTC
jgi:hypothetical protein